MTQLRTVADQHSATRIQPTKSHCSQGWAKIGTDWDNMTVSQLRIGIWPSWGPSVQWITAIHQSIRWSMGSRGRKFPTAHTRKILWWDLVRLRKRSDKISCRNCCYSRDRISQVIWKDCQWWHQQCLKRSCTQAEVSMQLRWLVS